MILKIPITIKTPTPRAIPPTSRIALSGPGTILTCFETIMILGSAHVINSPKANENNITINMFFCFESDEPIYSPTLLSDDEAPIWNNARPTIKATMPMRISQIFELFPSFVILAKPVKCIIKIIAIIGTIDRADEINADTCLFFSIMVF